MSTIGSPIAGSNFVRSAENLSAGSVLSGKSFDISIAWAAVGINSIKVGESRARSTLTEMQKQNSIAETANYAKGLEDKLKSIMAKAKLGDSDNLKSKATNWAEAKSTAEELVKIYESLGINSGSATKLLSGEFTVKDLEAMGSMTKGVSDKTTSANQMLNLDLTAVQNFISMSTNSITKAMDTTKQNMDRILR